MAKIEDYRRIIFHKGRGSIGKPNGVGEIILGYNEIGDHHKYLGTYQQRHSKKGPFVIKMKRYVPPDPMTDRQLANRYRYRVTSLSYQFLTVEYLVILKNICKNTRLNTQQMYLKLFIGQKPTYSGMFLLGENYIGDLTIN